MILKKSIYDAVCNYSTMESNIDCRIAISEVLPLLYIEVNEKTQKNDLCKCINKFVVVVFIIKHVFFFSTDLILNWWTTLMQLLYDDNSEVRFNAAQIICKILPETKLYCETIITDTFFVKFVSTVRDAVEAVAAACFCWSMKSAAVVLEEMDDTDVRI